MAIKVIHIIKLEETPALLKLLECLCKCKDKEEQLRQEIWDKLDATQKDLEGTIPDS